jgi:putative tryptophan/tyrosine transport system substrate-binding protein
MSVDRLRRRQFIAGLGSAAVWAVSARAQQQQPSIGFLGAASPEGYAPFVSGFRRGLKDAGFVDGENITIVYRWAEGQYDRLPALAADLVSRRVAVIVATGGLPSSLAAKAATSTIPIVFTLGSDPIKFGLVSSLNRPDGNITGVTLFTNLLDAKRLELMYQLVPKAAVIGLLINPNSPQTDAQFADVQATSRTFGQQLVTLAASTDADIDQALATLVQKKAGALLVSADAFFLGRRDQLVAAVARHSIPAIYEWRQFAEAGGLMSYGVDLADAYRQAGSYVAKILNGAKPADLPVLQPAKFEFVINLKTAKAMSLEIPPKLLALADDVIE